MGEFEAIQRIRQRLAAPGPEETWIGDDTAVVRRPAEPWLLLAADTVVAGVHADLSLTGLDDLGWKVMTANVSDVAAMGGRPGHALVTVAGPESTDLGLLYDGIAEAVTTYHCPVVGGDLTSSPTLVVTVAVTGTVDGPPVLRSGARPGDDIWATGPLGASAAGLRSYRSGPVVGLSPAEEAARLAHARPRAQLAAGEVARRAGARAMIDVSDGLASEVRHLAEASGVGVALTDVPVAPGATEAEALGGGEDYILVFCAPRSAPVRASFAGARLPAPLLIGQCREDPGERSLRGQPLPVLGWEHRWP